MAKIQRDGRVHTTMRLQPDLVAAADKEAFICGLSRTELFQRALARFLQGRGYTLPLANDT